MAKWSITDLLNIPANLLDLPLLERVYIPNLVPSLFTFNKAHAKLINNRTSSPCLSKVLCKWNKEHWYAPDGGRNLHRFSSLNCYCTSLHPQCAGSKPRTCSSSNTSLSASLRLAHPQCSLTWLSTPSRLNMKPRYTCRSCKSCPCSSGCCPSRNCSPSSHYHFWSWYQHRGCLNSHR